MGADPANATLDRAQPRSFGEHDAPELQDYDPWAGDVMILAGLAPGDRPWLWLACRKCQWFIGFSPQYEPSALAGIASRHECADPS
jgi:hypothetical protein